MRQDPILSHGEADLPSRGTSARTAIRSAIIRRVSRMERQVPRRRAPLLARRRRACAPISPRGSPAPPICSTGASGNRGRRSISSRRTTASRSPTSPPTTHKHNEANGEDNNDGHNENCSANWGVEGPTDDPRVLEARERVARALIATPLLSLGTPMLLGGDEFGRTQRGNNNAYCQDNEISWIDWDRARIADGRALTEFVARVDCTAQKLPGAARNALPLRRSRSAAGPLRRKLVRRARHGARDRSMAGPGRPRAHAAPRGAGPDRRNGRDPADVQRSSRALRFTPPAPHLEWNVLLDSAEPERRSGRSSAARWKWPRTASSCCLPSRPAKPTGRRSGWRARIRGRGLLTALPPDPGTMVPHRAPEIRRRRLQRRHAQQ